MKQILVLLLLLNFSNFNFAATVNWDNDSGDNQWSNPLNWSTNSLPLAADDVSITTGGFVVLSGLTTTVKSIYITSGTVFSVESTGNLTVDDSATHGINLAFGNPVLNNSGTINIANTGSIGLISAGNVTNFATGTISIDNSATHGFHISIGNTFINNGTFISTDSGTNGFSVSGDFENTSTGDITVTGSVAFGIYVAANRIFENFGTIDLDSNENALTIFGNFENATGGMLNISNSGQGLYTGPSTTLTNDAFISITNCSQLGINGNGTIINNDQIIIDGTTDKTAFLNAANTTNSQGASISILNSGDVGLSLGSGKTFDNLGDLIITNSVGHGISSLGTFNNASTGVATISNAGNFGFVNGNNKIFTNSGSVIIDGTGTYGIFNQGTVTNDAGATLTVSNAGTYGIFHQKNTIDNSGAIIISASGLDGIYNGSTLITNIQGEITISNTTGRGFYNAPAQTFTNNGILTVSGTTGTGFHNTPTGIVTNNGTVRGSDEFELGGQSFGGNIKPGFSPGTIDLLSDQTFTGTYEAEIGGTAQGTDFDLINVTGATTFSGAKINAVLINGFTPTPPEEFIILTSTTISGTPTVFLPPNTGTVIWTSEIGADYVKILATSALPVELIDFTAFAENEDIELNWSTATEINNEGFEIQYSRNGLDWKKLDFIDGAGNSVEERSYSFNHYNPGSGNHFYRLKQMDFDGNFEFSKTVTVDFDEKVGGLRLSPNPSSGTNQIKLSIDSDFDSSIVTILDFSGKIIFKRSISAQSTFIDTDDFPSGIYFVEVTSGRERLVEKLIVE